MTAWPGGTLEGSPDGVVTQGTHEEAIAYFEERARLIAEPPSRGPSDSPAASHAPAVHLPHSYPRQRAESPGKVGPRDDCPAPINVDGTVYASVTHASRALSAADPAERAAVAAADTAYAASESAAAAVRHDGWEHARSAVMTTLLRAKFTQHPDLAEILLATDDATLVYDDAGSLFWGDNAGRGRNWAGRLLELVRSELSARRAGII